MSAADWRRAMNRGSAAAPWPRVPAPATPVAVAVHRDPYADSNAPRWLKFLWRTVSPRHVLVAAFVLLYPLMATPFLTFQIGALLIGLAEQFGLAYAPTYSVVFTFVIMVVALAFKPRGIMGKPA